MVLLVGLTVMLLPVPAGVPPQEPLNHSMMAPVPKEPPETDKVAEEPSQIPVGPEIVVGATESCSTVIETD